MQRRVAGYTMWRPCSEDYPVFSQRHTKQIKDEEAKMYDENERERERKKEREREREKRKKIELVIESAMKKNDRRAFA